MNNKVKLFSHTDLDGHGCNIVAKYTIGKIVNLECENLNYDNVNKRIKEFFYSKELEEYNIVYITDISVNNEVAELIESKINKIGIKVRLLDHHPTALELNKYSWCTIYVERDGEKTSGTRMLYDELSWCIYNLNKKGLINKNRLFDFVENVRKYDTWLWKEKYNDFTPKKLNDLFFILGYERFENEIINNLNCNLYNTKNFIDENKLLLELQQEKIDKYIEKKNKEIIECDIAGNKAGVVFAEQFQSELGNKLSELNPQYDLIIMIGDKTISYRTVKDNVNCGEIAKLFSGGGHPKASGSRISDKVKLKYIKGLFKI